MLRHDSAQATSNAQVQSRSYVVNTSATQRNDYFRWPVEELIRCPRQDSGLKIIGRSSSFLFKGKSDNSRTSAKAGRDEPASKQRAQTGRRVRIVAELINARMPAPFGRKHTTRVEGCLCRPERDRQRGDRTSSRSSCSAHRRNPMLRRLTTNLAAYNALQQGTFYFRLSTEKASQGDGILWRGHPLRSGLRTRLCEFIERMATAGGWLAGWS